MSTTQPIKQIEEITKLKAFFREKNDVRNFVMIVMGMNTALRISDLLDLRWRSVYDWQKKMYYKHIQLTEQKTGKTNIVALNNAVIDALEELRQLCPPSSRNDFIFQSRTGVNRPITRSQAYRIINRAAKNLGIEGNISCHSLRKTFGYQAWKKGVPPAVIMEIYNHTSLEITKRYLAIDQDDKDEVIYSMNL